MSKSESFWDHPIETLEKAISLRKNIASLQEKLSSLFSQNLPSLSAVQDKRSGKRSTITVARMRAAQQKRWAKKDTTSVQSEQLVTTTAARAKRTMSDEARERIGAATKARWASQKAASGHTGGLASGKSGADVIPNKPKKKGGLTPEGRAKLAANMKARWAARRKGAAATNVKSK